MASRRNEQEYLGKVFGYWEVIAVANPGDIGHIYYRCRCICGQESNVRKTILKRGKSTSCGCNGGRAIKGQRFHRLITLSDAYLKNNGRLYVRVRCDCGTEKEVMKQSLTSELIQSCGCLNKEILRSRTGMKNHNYKPHLTDEERLANATRGSSSKYQKFRREVLKRDQNTCQCCGTIKQKDMRVHHLNSWNIYKNLRYDAKNAVTLCAICHDIQYEGSFHNTYGNGDNTEQQYEEWIRNKRKQGA